MQHTITDLASILSGFTPRIWRGWDYRTNAATDTPEGGDSAYISDFDDVDVRAGDNRPAEFFSLSSVTVWGDYVGSDRNRSNCRSLERDYPETFVSVRDAMGAEWLALPVSSLLAMEGDDAESLCRLLSGLADEYPLYDEEDHSVLEMELADEAWDAWVRFDLTRELRDSLNSDEDDTRGDRIVDAIGEEDLQERFYAAASDSPQPYYCETADSVVFPYWDDVVATLAEHYGA